MSQPTALIKLLNQVQSLSKEGDYFKVIELLDDSLLEKYNNADLFVEKGIALYKLKDLDSSILPIDRALSINPKHAKANNYKGNIIVSKEGYKSAFEYYQKAIEADAKYPYPYNNLGIAYYTLGDYTTALEYFNKAINLDKNYVAPYNGIGNVYQSAKDPKKAITFYNKAISVDPNYQYPYFNLGLIYFDSGEYEKAIKYLLDTTEINPIYAEPYNVLGAIYYNLNEYEKSINYYQVYINIATHFPDYSKYYTKVAESRINELKKIINNTEYGSIYNQVKKIKNLLLIDKGCITHYTSLSTAKALILQSSNFRLSEGAFLNDTSEGKELFKFLSFNYQLQSPEDTVAETFTQKPFIGCFVTEDKHDDLTLWRMYGKEEKEEAKGCSITIDMTKLIDRLNEQVGSESENESSPRQDEDFRFYRVAYMSSDGLGKFIIPGMKAKEKKLTIYMDELSKKVDTFISRDNNTDIDNQNVIKLLNDIAYLFKTAEYQHENEFRLVLRGVGFEKIVNPNSDPPGVYIELVPVRSLISKISLGPKVERAQEWASAFHYSLGRDDLHPEIHISHLPFK